MKYLIAMAMILLFLSHDSCKEPEPKEISIAFMADVHFNDVYCQFQDTDYKGVFNPKNGKYAILRTMSSQLHSTRIFNENYFAFFAALDDVVERGIKYVVLPGDFSDDGQPYSVGGLKKVLDEYAEKFGISFIVITGNHDPVRPFPMDAGKRDFLGEGGKQQPILSRAGTYGRRMNANTLPPVITKDMHCGGYNEILEILSDYGFYPRKEYKYWETPFSTYGTNDYSFDRALKEASLENRTYLVPPHNVSVPDVSYLVEPVDGLWLLALDGNVYIPRQDAVEDPLNPRNYSSSQGYINVWEYKKHLINWAVSVIQRADSLNKDLIAFSHYPILDCNDGATGYIEKLFGQDKMNVTRIPVDSMARVFADAGLRVHLGGHLHINDTEVCLTKKGNALVNIQIPSLAGYIPAYKLVTLKADHILEVETILIDSVPGFDVFFDLYDEEYRYLKGTGSENIWDREVLSAKSYHDYMNRYLKELTRLRYIPREWPDDFVGFLAGQTGKDLLVRTLSWIDDFPEDESNTETVTGSTSDEIPTDPVHRAQVLASINGLKLEKFSEWTGSDLIFDLYRLRDADQLAIPDIGVERIKQYKLIMELFMKLPASLPPNEDRQMIQLSQLANIFLCYLNGDPADHFQINLKTGDLKDMTDLTDLPLLWIMRLN